MTGLVYKEIRQNKGALLFCAFSAPIIMIGLFLMLLIGNIYSGAAFSESFAEFAGKSDANAGMPIFTLMTILYPFCVGGMLMLGVCTQDGTKKWGYFTASHPKGVRGAVYTKYVLIFAMSAITMVSVIFTNRCLILADHLILGTPNDQIVSYEEIAVFALFIQLFLRMIDIPFIVRFGKRRGEQAKGIAIGSFFFIIFIYALFGPLPAGEDNDPLTAIYDWYVSFIQGEAAFSIYTVIVIFLWVTIVGYYLSYRLSCKLYMKGVEQYDK